MTDQIFLAPDERLDEVNEELRLIQKRKGLTFGTDAYLLAAFTKPMPSANAVELGGGTGIVSLLLAKKKKIKRITALEIQPSFADLIDRNAKINGLSDRVFCIAKDLREVSPRDFSVSISLVVSNPPYLPLGAGRRNEEAQKEIARHECFGNIFDFCACAGRLLGSGGRFVTVWRPERLSDLYAALRQNGLEPKRTVLVHADSSAPPCAVLTEAVKDASPSLRILPPLFLYEKEADSAQKKRRMTPKAEQIYKTCSFDNQ